MVLLLSMFSIVGVFYEKPSNVFMFYNIWGDELVLADLTIVCYVTVCPPEDKCVLALSKMQTTKYASMIFEADVDIEYISHLTID